MITLDFSLMTKNSNSSLSSQDLVLYYPDEETTHEAFLGL